jgi:hypothetical protein
LRANERVKGGVGEWCRKKPKIEKMNGREADAELVKWCDAQDTLFGRMRPCMNVEKGLDMARECRHPDAKWLASLFPAGVRWTRERIMHVMLEQGEDPRAMFLAFLLGERSSDELIRRAAEMGYAPAQAEMSGLTEEADPEESRRWAERSSAQRDRNGLFQLAYCTRCGVGGREDPERAAELYRASAELGCALAMFYHARSLQTTDWRWHHWMGRATVAGLHDYAFSSKSVELLPAFERGELGRVLHTAAPVIRAHLDAAHCAVFGRPVGADETQALLRVVQLHDAMLQRARAAIMCWSLVGRRCRVAKDVRVVIAKMAWEEVWRWSDLQRSEKTSSSAASGGTHLAAAAALAAAALFCWMTS